MKILVVGCGSIGRRHAANARNFAEVLVTDVNAGLLSMVASELGVRGFERLDEALLCAPDGVVVATPHHTHIDVSRSALRAGAHVLIEKPISHNIEEADYLLAEAETMGRRVHVVCNMRYHPGIIAIREHLAEIGRPFFARAHYGNWLPSMRPGADYRNLYCARKDMGGGVILDAIHEIDYLQWLFGPIDSAVCQANKLSTLEIEVEDYAGMIVRHARGVRSEIHLDYLQRYKRRGCEITGECGSLIWLSEGKNPEKCRVRLFEEGRGSYETLLALDDLDTNAPYMHLMGRFVSMLAGENVPDLLDGREALHDLEVALAAKRSAETDSVEFIANRRMDA